MIRRAITAALAANLAIPPAAHAATRDLDWPCQQIKVPSLSLAAVWSGPPIDLQQAASQNDRPTEDLVQSLAARREPVEQAQATIHLFAQQAGDQKQHRLIELLASLFNVLDAERNSIIAGLDRFGGRQKELAADIRLDNEKLHSLQTGPSADPNLALPLAQQVKWEVELFQDRRQAISYACDVPSKIEQRLFTLAHQIQNDLE